MESKKVFFVAHMVKSCMICRCLNARRCFWRMDHHCWMIGDLTVDIREFWTRGGNEVEWNMLVLDVFFWKGNCVAMRNHRFFTLMVDISGTLTISARLCRWSMRHQGAVRLPGMGNSFREDSLGCLRPGHATHINQSAVFCNFAWQLTSVCHQSNSYQLSVFPCELVTIGATLPGISKTYAGISMVRRCASAVFSPLAGVNGRALNWHFRAILLRFGPFWACPSWFPSRALS